MQEKYVGDTPDFVKYALLRALCVDNDDYPPLRLGVNWYLTLGDEVDRADNMDGEMRHHAAKSDVFIQGMTGDAASPTEQPAIMRLTEGGVKLGSKVKIIRMREIPW